MRNFLIFFLISLVAVGARAGDSIVADFWSEETPSAPSQTSSIEAQVSVVPVPMPATVIEIARYAPKGNTIGQSKRAKAAKVARVKSMLSRSAREQIALATKSTKSDVRILANVSDQEDVSTGIDEQDLHRSFSQPKVAKTPNQRDDEDEDGAELPDHIKLRLLVARTRAVEAHILNQAGKAPAQGDEELSETVKLRLYVARARALQAHSDKYGST